MLRDLTSVLFFFFNDTATTEIYTLSLHDALPIWTSTSQSRASRSSIVSRRTTIRAFPSRRSEEHTSELQSRFDLVCRLLLEKKKVPQNLDDGIVEIMQDRIGT